MNSEKQISDENITNNKTVRNTLISRGIMPETLSPQEDVKKIERKLLFTDKKVIKNSDKLSKKKI